jgi:hypothetical protein
MEYKYTLFHPKTVLFISTNSTCSMDTAGEAPEQHTMWVHGDTSTSMHVQSHYQMREVSFMLELLCFQDKSPKCPVNTRLGGFYSTMKSLT